MLLTIMVFALHLYLLFCSRRKNCGIYTDVKTDDIDVIADMNIDIAFSLAENENLAGKRFSVWYRGTQEEENACN